MKILELRLRKFGPFTDRILDLSAGNKGLHIIFGPNEAGKSSALRALHALLYGIPGQTNDAFLHPYGELRIGGRLRLLSGEEIEFSRRKATKGSLMSADETRLDDRALDRFLAGIGEDQFRMFWGIDHARLVQGGREILEGHGDLGAILFAAGSGASHLGPLRKRLEEEAAGLFAPRGHNRPVNQAINHLRELRSAQREATVSADDWVRQDSAAADAQGRIEELTKRMQELSREKSRHERLKRVLPLLAERREVCEHLTSLGNVVVLAEDFPSRRRETETVLRTAQQRLDRVAGELKEQEEIIAKLGEAPPLAAEAEVVSNLHRSVGSHRKALSDRPHLVGRRDEQTSLGRRLLGELRPDLDIEAAEALRPFAGRRTRIQKLAAEQERLDERLDAARRRQSEAKKNAATLLSEGSSLPPARDPGRLISAIEETRRRGDTEAEKEKANRVTQRIVTQRDAALRKLLLPASAIDKLEALRVPTPAAIARFERRAQELEDEARLAKAEGLRLAKNMRELDVKIESLRVKKAVPTEEDLAAARTRRDEAFSLLRSQWEKGRDVAAEARELLGRDKLLDLYPEAVKAADEVADRLRSESDRVAELSQYMEERQRIQKEAQQAETASQRREKHNKELCAAWREAWGAVVDSPPPIHDARAWREEFDRLLERSLNALEAQHVQEELDRWMETRLGVLRSALADLEPDMSTAGGLSAVLATAEKLRQRIEREDHTRTEHARKKRDNDKEMREAVAAVQAAQDEIEEWKRKWEEATRGLVLGGPLPPDDALLALDRVDRILRAIDEAAGYEARIKGIDRDAGTFSSEVRLLAQRLSELVEVGSEDIWVEALHGRLAAVLQEDERRRQAWTRMERLQADVATAEESVSDAERTLIALRTEAQCSADADLAVLEGRSADFRQYHSDIRRIEKELLRAGEGASIEEVQSLAAGVDIETIEARLVQIGIEMPEVEREISEARDARASAQAELRRLRGPSAASDKAEEIQATLARLGDDVVRYARLRMASTLLTRRIDEYRRKNQAPLLLRAGDLFQEMTLQSFERLEADVEEDIPILVGVKPDGTRVPSHGMSEGSLDQLFLSLRLAAVEASCAASEPMPFIADDVLVQFDDNRCAAALHVLAEVAVHTQVILFTHHGHVRKCAETLKAPAGVTIHEL